MSSFLWKLALSNRIFLAYLETTCISRYTSSKKWSFQFSKLAEPNLKVEARKNTDNQKIIKLKPLKKLFFFFHEQFLIFFSYISHAIFWHDFIGIYFNGHTDNKWPKTLLLGIFSLTISVYKLWNTNLLGKKNYCTIFR